MKGYAGVVHKGIHLKGSQRDPVVREKQCHELYSYIEVRGANMGEC